MAVVGSNAAPPASSQTVEIEIAQVRDLVFQGWWLIASAPLGLDHGSSRVRFQTCSGLGVVAIDPV